MVLKIHIQNYLNLFPGPLQLRLGLGGGLGQLYPLVLGRLNLLLELRELAAVDLGEEIARRARLAEFVAAVAILLLKVEIKLLFPLNRSNTAMFSG